MLKKQTRKVLVAFICYAVLFSFTSFDSGREYLPPKKVTVFSQKISAENVKNFLLAQDASNYIFQNIVMPHNSNREKYDLYVYIYDSQGQIIPRPPANDYLFTRMNHKIQEPADEFKLSIYKMDKQALKEMVDAHPNFTYLKFEVERSRFTNHVDYIITPDDVDLKFEKSDSIIINEDGTYYRKHAKYKVLRDFLYLNPSPPAR